MTDKEEIEQLQSDIEDMRSQLQNIEVQILEFKNVSHYLAKIIGMVSCGEKFEYSDGMLVQNGSDPDEVAASRLAMKAGNKNKH